MGQVLSLYSKLFTGSPVTLGAKAKVPLVPARPRVLAAPTATWPLAIHTHWHWPSLYPQLRTLFPRLSLWSSRFIQVTLKREPAAKAFLTPTWS